MLNKFRNALSLSGGEVMRRRDLILLAECRGKVAWGAVRSSGAATGPEYIALAACFTGAAGDFTGATPHYLMGCRALWFCRRSKPFDRSERLWTAARTVWPATPPKLPMKRWDVIVCAGDARHSRCRSRGTTQIIPILGSTEDMLGSHPSCVPWLGLKATNRQQHPFNRA